VADVDFGVRNLDAEGSEAAEHSSQVATARGAANNQVALEADTIDGSASVLDDAHQLERPVGLGAVVLEVVVVVVELSAGVSGAGGAEGDSKVVGAEGAVEDGVAPVAVVVDGLVHNVPVVALALVVAHDVIDVRFDDTLESAARPVARGDLHTLIEGLSR